MLRLIRSAVPHSAARLYLFFATLMAFACILLIPPGQMPDERNHFARITQISQGGIVAIKNGPDTAGGYLPKGFPQETEFMDRLRFHPENKVEVAELEALSTRHWSHDREWISFRNTAIYAPLAYLPAACVTFIGRHTRSGMIQTLYAVHVLNALLTVLLCGLGIALARRGKFYLLLLSSLPMVMGLAAASSQDGLLFALAVVTAAMMTRLSHENSGGVRFWIGIGLLFTLLTVSKPPLLPCSLIALGFGFSRKRLALGAPFLMSFAGLIIWQKFGLNPAKVVFRAGSGVYAPDQVLWVVSHPLALPGLAYRTLYMNLGHLVHEFVGVLGWLDTPMPRLFYRLVYGLILGCLAFGAFAALRCGTQRQTMLRVITTLVMVLLATGGIFFSLYVIWTPVGAPVIEGVQGRYFLPIAPFLALVFPAMPEEGGVGARTRVHQGAMLIATAFLAIDLVTLTCVLATRYW